jgi:uncharacterized phosphosugar-binding protein
MTDPTSPGMAYIDLARRMLDRVRDEQGPGIREAAELVADAVGSGHVLHAFGTGHSHLLAEELFHRAGGLVRVRPILFAGLMLHESAALSTALERLPAVADALLAAHAVERGDVLIVASNSGGNAVASRLVQRVQPQGVRVIAVTSLRHATSSQARANELPRLHELADVVLDNGGVIGDAAIEIRGLEQKVAPTSTVLGAAILNAVVAEAVQLLVDRGTPPDIYTSANVEGGDEANARFLGPAGSS